MRLETCIRKSLGWKAHTGVKREERPDGSLAAPVDGLPCRRLQCGEGGAPAATVAKPRRPARRWRDLGLRERVLGLLYAPHRVYGPTCGLRVERIPWAAKAAGPSRPVPGRGPPGLEAPRGLGGRALPSALEERRGGGGGGSAGGAGPSALEGPAPRGDRRGEPPEGPAGPHPRLRPGAGPSGLGGEGPQPGGPSRVAEAAATLPSAAYRRPPTRPTTTGRPGFPGRARWLLIRCAGGDRRLLACRTPRGSSQRPGHHGSTPVRWP